MTRRPKAGAASEEAQRDRIPVVDKRGKPKREPSGLPPELPVLPLNEAVLFPNLALPVFVGRERSLKLVDEVVAGNRMLAAVAVREPGEGEPGPERLHSVGTAARVAELVRLPTGGVQVALQGISRVRFTEWVSTDPYLRARVEALEAPPPDEHAQMLMRSVLTVFRDVAELAPYIPPQFAVAAVNIGDPGDLADFLSANLNIEPGEKQKLLATLDVGGRLELLERHLQRERDLLQLSTQAQEQLTEDVRKVQREQFLRRQLEVIRNELGEGDDESSEIEELRRAVAEAEMPEEAAKAAERELARLERIPSASPERTVSRNYLDWLLAVPWSVLTTDDTDLEHAQQILDEDHYGLEKIKERIVEHLAVLKLRPGGRAPILLFVGPPGVGKTSLGQSIARALGRKFVRMSLGGIRDEAEIRGHRRTYIGALPGRIVQSLRKAGSLNPVMMLDEIDKIGMDIRGDPSAALLEVLDPEQNHSFSDHYLEVPLDLSHVLFICTANMLDTIPAPLRDRMETIELRGYTEPEKLAIAKRYLVPRQITEHGLKKSKVGIADEALRGVIRNYTHEAGVRNLEREIAGVLRKVARDVAGGQTARKVTVRAKDLEEMLGPPRIRRDEVRGADEVGVATGLAWTPAGGDVLFVEASLVEGKGRLTLTGKLGDVMKESAQAALTYARSLSDTLEAPEGWHENFDVHVHVPAGAIPKDGPSAGITLATALISAVTKVPVRRRVAMTGEITLRGRILPVGGIKEKVIAAHRAGVKCVILPMDNEPDLREVPDFVRKDLRIVFAEHMDEVLREALASPPKALRRAESISPAGSPGIRERRSAQGA